MTELLLYSNQNQVFELFGFFMLKLKWKLLSYSVHENVSNLTLKHRKTHECVVSTVATDALVLKHQAISIHIAD